MLVLVSDIHLADEATASNAHPEAFSNVLVSEIETAATSKKAQELHLALLGDIVDFVRTDFWLKKPAADRPWNGRLHPDTAMNTAPSVETDCQEVLTQILSKPTATAFRDLCQRLDNLPVDGRRLKLQVTYVIGNHDRYFFNFSSLQTQFKDWLGVPVAFGPELAAADYELLGRHGHVWDEHCYGYDLYRKVLHRGSKVDRFDPVCYRVQTIGEVITAELMSGIVHHVRTHASGQNTPDLYKKVMETNNVRPDGEALRYLEWAGHGTFNDEDKALIMDAVKTSVKGVLSSELAKQWDKTKTDWLVSGDLTDRLSLLQKVLGRDFSRLEKTAPVLEGLYQSVAGGKDEYAAGARSEIHDRGVSYVVYGHTHDAKTECVTCKPDGTGAMYVNTGTYLPLIRKASESGFGTDYRMTLTFFYRGDEDTRDKKDRRVSCEVWSGLKRKVYGNP
jgi:UDP-2,3-diacylglucosamine pyrophosphatase LpxH